MPDPKVTLAKDDEIPPPPDIKLADNTELPPAPKNTYSFDINKYGNKSKSTPIASIGLESSIMPMPLLMNKSANADNSNATNRTGEITDIVGKYSPIDNYKQFKIVGKVGEETSYNRNIIQNQLQSNNFQTQSSPYQTHNNFTASLGGELSPDFLKDKQTLWPYVASQIKGSYVGAGVGINGGIPNAYANFNGQLDVPVYKDRDNRVGIIINPANINLSTNHNETRGSGGFGISEQNNKLGLSTYLKGVLNDGLQPEIQFGLKKTFNTPKKYPPIYYGSGQNERYL